MPRVGDTIGGRYRLDALIGSGGMGVVYAATDVPVGRRVAVKCLKHDASETSTARFLREARIVSSLTTEHVAHVHHVGCLDDGAPYLVMDLLVGTTLQRRVQERGRLGIEEAADHVLSACDALADAHAHGVVHRDVKPSNLFLAHDAHGRPTLKVIDFGISQARMLAGPDGAASETTTGALLGSPPFMSPEQIRAARNVDARTDIWSLGVVVYWLLSGRMPFVADSLLDLMTLIAYEAPAPLAREGGDVPPELAAVVARCLGKRREDRYGSAGELAAALAPFASAEGRRIVDQVVRRGPPIAITGATASPAVHSPDAVTLDMAPTASRSAPARPRPRRTALVLALAASGVALVAVGIAVGTRVSTRIAAGASPVVASAPVVAPSPPAPSTTPADAPSASAPQASAEPPVASRPSRAPAHHRAVHVRGTPKATASAALPSTPD